ncbi:MAG: thiaminase II [Tannerella sp.]|jgi:thiaminase/transcriptional activator TenA|nr:thiaminase II [Tannerella sp.]
MKWSEKAWEAILPVYNRIIELPFIRELMDGTLEKEKFAYYIQQDALYLADYGRLLTAIATRLTKTGHIAAFIRFANDSVTVEKELHQTFAAELSSAKNPSMSPACLLYTSYLLRQLNAPVEVMAAAILPCFSIYKEVGDYISTCHAKANNPYQAWIDTYSGEVYEKTVREAVAICNELAESATPALQQTMTEAYITASKLEWMFWNSAFKLEQWEI